MSLPLLVSVPGYPFRVLPPGIHVVTGSEFKIVFLDNAPPSLTRSNIYAGLIRLTNRLLGYNIIKKIWFDGSFVTDKQDPDDIEVCIFLDIVVFSNLPDSIQDEIWELLGDSERCYRDYLCDVKRIRVYMDGDIRNDLESKLLEPIQYYYARVNPEQASNVEMLPQPKGFVEIVSPLSFPLPDATARESKSNQKGERKLLRSRDILSLSPHRTSIKIPTLWDTIEKDL
jgi:hypothetical protein